MKGYIQTGIVAAVVIVALVIAPAMTAAQHPREGHSGPPMMGRDGHGRRPEGPPPPRERRSEGGTPGHEEHQRMFRHKMEELQDQQRRLREELQEHVRRVHQQLDEIEQHKRRLAEDLQRHVHQARPDHERRMHHERGERQRHRPEEMARPEREQHERRMHEERERQEHGKRERERQERGRYERGRYERERQERPRGERPGPRGSMHGLPGLGLLLSPRLREELRLSDKQAKQDFDKPNKSKAYKKDRPKRAKPPTSKSASADRKRGVVLLRLLQDPAVRAELGLSDEQEKRIFVLHEKVQRIQDSIRADVRDVIRNRMKQARTPQDRSDIKRQAAEIAKEATRAAGGDMETIMKEAAQVLTPDQQAKLRTIDRDRAEMFRATGGLAILLAPNVREKIGISDEQADRIRPLLQDISKRAKDLRAESAGARPPEGLKRRHVEMVREARQRVMGVLSAEQREMAERLLDRGPRKGPPNRGPLEAAPATKGYGHAV